MVKFRATTTVLSAFTGAGGLDLGLERSGFTTVAAIELDRDARQTILANRPEWNLLPDPDITRAARVLTPGSIGLSAGQLGVLAAGPPCQPFSKAAQWRPDSRLGIKDPRARCLMSLLSLVDVFVPHVLLIENVPGFVKGSTSALATISGALRKINRKRGTAYQLDCRIIDACQFGVPQRRRRAILIATRDGSSVTWPERRPLVTAFDALANTKPSTSAQPSGYWARLLPSIPPGKNYLFHTPGAGGQPLFGDRRRFWSFLLKLAPSEPAWTISAKPGPSTGPFHWDNRPLAVEEMLALQTFPCEWKVNGGRTSQMRQIGNATPPLLAEVIGRAIGRSIFGKRYARSPTLAVPPASVPVPVPRVARVPRFYLKHRGNHPPHPGEGKGPRALPW